jgi:hypothetical protein
MTSGKLPVQRGYKGKSMPQIIKNADAAYDFNKHSTKFEK